MTCSRRAATEVRYVEAPERLQRHQPGDGPVVFLAGGITGCLDWQAEARDLLDDTDLVVCNPRQPTFDVTDPNAAGDQIAWEAEHLRAADLVLFWFPASGEVPQPIALFELGMALGQRRDLAVGTDPDYCCRYDVMQQSGLPGPRWTLHSLDPLHIEPSVLCGCGHHGWIRGGCWCPA